MATTSQETMEFDGSAAKVLAELRKIVDQQKLTERASLDTAKAAEKGANAAAEALKQQARAVKELQKENDALREKVGAVGRAQHEANEKTSAGHLKTGAAIGVAVAGLKKAVELQSQWYEKTAATALEQDKIGRKLQVQAMMRDEEFQKKLTKNIMPTAWKYGVSLVEAQQLSQTLLNAGVDTDPAMGAKPGNNVLAEAIQAAQATGADPNVMAEGIAGMLRAQGRDQNAANFREISASMAGLFRPNKLQGTDIGELAKIGALTKQAKLDTYETLAAFTTLRHEGNLDAGEATTQLRNVIVNMQAPNQKTREIIEKAGGAGAAERIDMVGESFPQAVENLRAIVASLPERERPAFMEQMFGKESLAASQLLLSPEGQIAFEKHMREQFGGERELRENVAIASSGPSPAQNRIDLDRKMLELRDGDRNLRVKQMLEAYHNKQVEQGDWNWVATAKQFLVGLSYDLNTPGGPQSWLKNGGPPGLRGLYAPAELEHVPFAGRKEFVPPAAAPLPKRPDDFRLFGKSDRDRNIEELELEVRRQQLAKDRQEAAFRADDSRGGARITAAEKRQLDALERLVRVAELQLDELRYERDEQQRRGSEAAAAAAGGGGRARPLAPNRQIE